MKDGVERDEKRRDLVAALREHVPDEDHRDAPREADEDQSRPVVGQVRQKQPREREHDDRPEDPVEHERRREQLSVRADRPELAVANLGEHRVHHPEKSHRDRQGDAADLDRVEQRAERGIDAAERDAEAHRDEDPDRQEPVDDRELHEDLRRRAQRRARRRAHGFFARMKALITAPSRDIIAVSVSALQHAEATISAASSLV